MRPAMTAHEFAPGLFIRGFAPPLALSDYRLVAFDMDSTLINIECIDEIAAAAGRREEVAAITEAAMRGEIADYKDSLRRRVALLRGVPESALHAVYSHHLQLNPGVARFVQACREAGFEIVSVPSIRQVPGASNTTPPSSSARWSRTVASPEGASSVIVGAAVGGADPPSKPAYEKSCRNRPASSVN